ncbi:MAG TPA: response regulator, partial [Chthoniobacterales bacterium]
MPTVLIIEDDVESRRKVARLFSKHGWDVIEALEGKEGIELAFSKRPDAIVCDLLLPKISGLQVCRAIREQLDLSRIIVMAGRRYNIDREDVLEAGGDDYFLKPLKWEKLAAVLKRPRRRSGKLVSQTSRSLKFHPPSTRIKFWGVRGSIPVPGPSTIGYGGNTTCVEVRTNGDIIILDAGSGIRELGLSLHQEFGSAPINLTLLLTHTH